MADDVKVERKFKAKKQVTMQRQNLHHGHVPSDEMDLLIETINTMDLGWKADVCKLQKTHRMYDAQACEPTVLAQTSEPDPTSSEDMLKLAAVLQEAEDAASAEEKPKAAEPALKVTKKEK